MLAKGDLAGTGRSGGGAQYVRLLDLASVIGGGGEGERERREERREEDRERERERRLRINLAST